MILLKLLSMPDNSNVSSDGSCVTDDLAEVSVAGAGVSCEESRVAWGASCWDHLDDVQLGGEVGGQGRRLFCSVPRPLESVQRAELWEVILALQAYTPYLWEWPSRMWLTTLPTSYPEGGRVGLSPLEKMETCLLQYMIDILRVRGQRTVQVCKVKGHACHGGCGCTREGPAR